MYQTIKTPQKRLSYKITDILLMELDVVLCNGYLDLEIMLDAMHTWEKNLPLLDMILLLLTNVVKVTVKDVDMFTKMLIL